MNAAMSDAWHFPRNAGQGFFLTVFEQPQRVFMGGQGLCPAGPLRLTVRQGQSAGRRLSAPSSRCCLCSRSCMRRSSPSRVLSARMM